MRTGTEKVITWCTIGAAAPALLVALPRFGQVDGLVGAALLIGALPATAMAPPSLVLLLTSVVVVISPIAWPQVGQLGDAAIRLGDVLLLLFACASLARSRHRASKPVLKALGVFLLLGVFRSSLGGEAGTTLSFLRVMEPVVVGAAMGLSLPQARDPWRTVRWALLGVLAMVPLTGGTFPRWSGLPGGPNEVALIAAVLVVLGVAETHKGLKILFVLGGISGLVGSRGILACAGALAGVAVLSLGGRVGSRGTARRRVSPLVIVGATACAFFSIPVLRPDMGVTLQVHATQAESFWPAMAATNPLFGDGWATADREALMSTYRQTHLHGLHNVYLDITVFLGALGLITFLLLLRHVWRNSNRVARAVLITVAVWFNTIGAFPGPGWGILGLVVMAAVSHVPAGESGPAGRVPPPGGDASGAAPANATGGPAYEGSPSYAKLARA